MAALLASALAFLGSSTFWPILIRVCFGFLDTWYNARHNERTGAEKAAAAANKAVKETTDAMDKVARPTDDEVEASLKSGTF